MPGYIYVCKILEKSKIYSLRTLETKKKNKKKSGSNDKNLRKLEPQQNQRVLIKKKGVAYLAHWTCIQGPKKVKTIQVR